MFKKTITYNDYNGVERKEDFYFNLTKAELVKMDMKTPGGFINKVNRVISKQDQPELVEIFEELVHKSFGVKTPDGRGFSKPAAELEAFLETEAYSILFMELVTNADFAAQFFNGIIPAPEQKQIPAKN